MRIPTRLLILLALSLSSSYCAVAQQKSPVDREKLRQAQRTADRFVERYRQTLDFGTAWREFRVSDASCNYRLDGPWNAAHYAPLRLSDALVERLYIAYMNCVYLSFSYRLSTLRIRDDDNYDRAVEMRLPKAIQAAEKRLENIFAGRLKPQDAKDVEEVVAELDQLARVWRRHRPQNLMRSAAWRANIKYALSQDGIGHLGVRRGGQSDLCIPDDVTHYIVDRGLFYFYFIEEKGRMKVVRFGLGD